MPGQPKEPPIVITAQDNGWVVEQGGTSAWSGTPEDALAAVFRYDLNPEIAI
ncbi:hypothetical protein BH10PSE7_BH10PSE7_33220 [soil metagenome]